VEAAENEKGIIYPCTRGCFMCRKTQFSTSICVVGHASRIRLCLRCAWCLGAAVFGLAGHQPARAAALITISKAFASERSRSTRALNSLHPLYLMHSCAPSWLFAFCEREYVLCLLEVPCTVPQGNAFFCIDVCTVLYIFAMLLYTYYPTTKHVHLRFFSRNLCWFPLKKLCYRKMQKSSYMTWLN
jgi:hypothetical protein